MEEPSVWLLSRPLRHGIYKHMHPTYNDALNEKKLQYEKTKPKKKRKEKKRPLLKRLNMKLFRFVIVLFVFDKCSRTNTSGSVL